MSEVIKIKEIKSMETGDIVAINAVVASFKEVDTTGKNYNQTYVTVADRTGETKFIVWKKLEQVKDELEEGMVYKFHGVIDEYRQEKQFKFSSASLLENSEENQRLHNPYYSKGITDDYLKMFNYIIENKIVDPRYRRYAQVYFGLGDVPVGVDEKEYRTRLDNFKKAFCSINNHDNYSGGLFNHEVGMARMVVNLKKQYSEETRRAEKVSNVNWDHLLLLCFIHDYDKQKEYIVDSLNENKCNYNPEVKVHHSIEGVATLSLMDREVESELRLTRAELEALKYGIMCHHGQYGTFELKSEEDKIFHCIDMIDAACVDKLTLD